MKFVLDIPAGYREQVASAFRTKANEYHGAVKRWPNDKAASEWQERATWLDDQANRLLEDLPSPIIR